MESNEIKQPDLSNSAKRLINVLEKGKRCKENSSTIQVWCEVFDFNKAQPMDIFRKLSLLSSEVDLTEEKMRGKGFRLALYKPHLNQIKAVFNPTNIDANWGNYKQYITDTNILSLELCADIIDNEPVADFQELGKILSELTNFKQKLENEIDDATYRFIINYINIIEEIISNYPIVGKESIVKGYKNLFFETATNYPIDKTDSEKQDKKNNALDTLKEYMRKMNKAVEEVIKTDAKLRALGKIFSEKKELAEGAIKLIGNIFSN